MAASPRPPASLRLSPEPIPFQASHDSTRFEQAPVKRSFSGCPHVTDFATSLAKLFRFMASGGMAEEDPEVVRALLRSAERMARLALEDKTASARLRSAASEFLRELKEDTYGYNETHAPGDKTGDHG